MTTAAPPRAHARVVTALGALALIGALSAPAASAAGATVPPCRPDSGRQLANAHVTQAQVRDGDNLRCANLRGADLHGLTLSQVSATGADLRGANLAGADLVQAELGGADLAGANLEHADLTQATLDLADLTGAKLANAKLGQADAKGTNFTKADLSGVDFGQAELGHATFHGANLGGADFTQAHSGGADFSGVSGLIPYDLYLLIAAGVLFLILAYILVSDLQHSKLITGSQRVKALVFGLLGRAVIVLGVHVFVGSLVGVITSAIGQPTTQTCSGIQCSVGVGVGVLGPFLGILAIFVGFGVSGIGSSPTPAGLP